MPQSYEDVLASAFEDELTKIAQAKLAELKPWHKVVGLMLAGGAAHESLRRANQDRRMGRAMRLQQGSY